jgi:hypothetical protein
MLTGLLVFVRPTAARGQISPGKLARAHASLEGTANCVQCHPLNRQPMAQACLTCHKDIQSLVSEKRGYHGRLPASQRLECASCHPDHAGAEFAMIEWPGGTARFDHRQAGWTLEGKHATTTCEKCHTVANKKDAVAVLSKRKSGTPWTGMGTTCASCHARDDIHEGELKGGCDQCHDAKTWEKATRFSHDKARFELTGKHADVKCAACHETTRLARRTTKNGLVVPVFRPVPFAKCSDCHTDPHKGRLRQSCTSCHATSGWDSIDKRSFDHSATRYPLKGRHARVSCAACHGKDNDKPTPAFASCASCHADVHRGEATKGRDCASCHVVDGFAPATFSVASHAATAYPLEGKHATIACAKCHTTSTAATGASAAAKYVKLAMPSGSCLSCHQDVHGGQSVSTASTTGCVQCHTVSGFAPSTISAARHASFRYALEGAHASAACAACHGSVRAGLPPLTTPAGSAKFVFALGSSAADTSCATCHADPHAGRYARGGAKSALGCRGCHELARFRPSIVSSANHDRFGYAIDGAHRAVDCAQCHQEMRARPAASSLKLATGQRALPFASPKVRSCAQCHADVHGAQFAKRKDQGACEGCHVTDRFVGAARFDHGKTRFTLTGAHAQVACARCHGVTSGADSSVPLSARRQYAGVALACESCHAPSKVGVR